MQGRVRCLCGRYMKFHKHELATYVSGGRTEYRCSRCSAMAIIWSAHGTDTMPIGGAIWSADDRVRAELGWSDESLEWYPHSKRLIAA
jgi:hypothetical protein